MRMWECSPLLRPATTHEEPRPEKRSSIRLRTSPGKEKKIKRCTVIYFRFLIWVNPLCKRCTLHARQTRLYTLLRVVWCLYHFETCCAFLYCAALKIGKQSRNSIWYNVSKPGKYSSEPRVICAVTLAKGFWEVVLTETTDGFKLWMYLCLPQYESFTRIKLWLWTRKIYVKWMWILGVKKPGFYIILPLQTTLTFSISTKKKAQEIIQNNDDQKDFYFSEA